MEFGSEGAEEEDPCGGWLVGEVGSVVVSGLEGAEEGAEDLCGESGVDGGSVVEGSVEAG